jgi:LCP family protein required for cell wall assembly
VVFVVVLAVLFVAVSTWIGYVLFRQVRDVVAGSGFFPSLIDEGDNGDSGPLPQVFWEPWEGTDRVNILVLGVDERESEEGPWRTDTILILTVDPLTLSAGMLSVPRDLWVPIPGYDQGRINTAHYLGDAYDYPGGGPGLAVETVQHNLGVPINYYVRLNFRAFVEGVDLIGGLDIFVEEEINDPEYPSSDPLRPYDYDPLYIPAGMIHMDGELALKYARTRHSSGGDFDRAARQQQVLRAILEKVTAENLLPVLITQAPQVWETLTGSIITDLTLSEIISLAILVTEIPSSNVESAVIDESCTMFWETPDGQQVLVPLRDCMRQIRDEIFTSEPIVPEDVDASTRLEEEAATVSVLNGTGIAGLADATASYLQEHGIQEPTTGNADRYDYAESLIYVYTGKVFTAETIAGLLGLAPTAVIEITGAVAEADIVVILGADYELPTQ